MAQPAYPTAADLQGYLTALGMGDSLPMVPVACGAGIAAFEREAGRTMLAGSPQTRQFDPPAGGRLLDIAGDLAAAPAVTYSPYGGATENLAAGADYRTEPLNRIPIEAIRFLRHWAAPLPFPQLGKIGVTGAWGYGTSIPDDAWLAM